VARVFSAAHGEKLLKMA
jgi:hypothetical protein